MTVVISGTNGITNVNGSASAPAETGATTNTGLFFPATNVIGFSNNGAESARLDASGNLGLGVTPSAYTGLTRAIDLQYYGTVNTGDDGNRAYTSIGNNYYEAPAGTQKYKTSTATVPATMYRQRDGQHQWFYAPNGTAGNNISFTQAMTLDASGRLGIGQTSPTFKLDVSGTSDIASLSSSAAGQLLRLSQSSANPVILRMNNNSNNFWDTQVNTDNSISWDYNDSEKARIDSSGNVGIGTSSPTQKLDVYRASGLARLRNQTGDASQVDWQFQNSGGSGYLGLASTGENFYDSRGAINAHSFQIVGSEKARIDSSGRFVVGSNSSSGGSASDTFIEVRQSGDAFIAVQGGSFGSNKQGFVYRRNGTYGSMAFAAASTSISTYTFNQFDPFYWYKWDGSTATTAARIDPGGAMVLRSTLTQNGTPDYAEYFEWADGNPNAEDRKGKTVVIDGTNGKIRLATQSDSASAIIGVCSRTYGVILDSQEFDWANKYLKNEFGEILKEEIEYVEYLESNGNLRSRMLSDGPVPDDAENVRYFTSMNDVVNPNFDENAEYIPRSKRKEWEPIGLVGKLRIIKGQPVNDRWVKMRDVSETVEEWLIR